MDRNSFRESVAEFLQVDSEKWIEEGEERSYYQAGFGLYENKEYRKAGAVFTRLVLTNPFYPPYWRALAASKQMSREYEAALHAWALVLLLEEKTEEVEEAIAFCASHLEEDRKAPDVTKLRKALQESAHVLH